MFEKDLEYVLQLNTQNPNMHVQYAIMQNGAYENIYMHKICVTIWVHHTLGTSGP